MLPSFTRLLFSISYRIVYVKYSPPPHTICTHLCAIIYSCFGHSFLPLFSFFLFLLFFCSTFVCREMQVSQLFSAVEWNRIRSSDRWGSTRYVYVFYYIFFTSQSIIAVILSQFNTVFWQFGGQFESHMAIEKLHTHAHTSLMKFHWSNFVLLKCT